MQSASSVVALWFPDDSVGRHFALLCRTWESKSHILALDEVFLWRVAAAALLLLD